MYLSIIKIALPALIAGVISFGGAWKLQGVKMESVRADLKQARIELTAAHAANQSNQEAISRLKDELQKSNIACNTRMKIKEELAAKIRKIDALKNEKTMFDKGNAKKIDSGASERLDLEGENEKNSNIDIDDPILHELNRMFGKNASSNR